jgi:hypothetical protein
VGGDQEGRRLLGEKALLSLIVVAIPFIHICLDTDILSLTGGM